MAVRREDDDLIFRSGYRGYILLLILFLVGVTAIIAANIKNNYVPILLCATIITLLLCRLVFAQYIYSKHRRMVDARRRVIASTSPDPRLSDAGLFRASLHRRNTYDDEFTIVGHHHHHQHHAIFTIPIYDLPPDYDEVTKDEAIPAVHSYGSRECPLTNINHVGGAPKSYSGKYFNTTAINFGRNRSESWVQKVSNSSLVVDDNAFPPTYSEALEARLKAQLGRTSEPSPV